MRTTLAWAFWRRTQYVAGFAALFLLIGGWIYYAYFYQSPTCFDNKQNHGETGVDCGGNCVRICAFSVNPPEVKWSRAFRVTNGIYNAVAYVENTNREAASGEVKYKFSLFDAAGLITEVSGSTILPPDGLYPIFEGRVATGVRAPNRTFIEIEPVEVWQPSTLGREQFTVVERSLADADFRPRLDAKIRNNGLEEVREVEVVATIFDQAGTALASSRTFVDNFAPRSDTPVVFTWPEPIAKTLRSCEVPTDVAVAIDTSGSMNNDGAEPPQPLTAVKEAAARFVNRLGEKDQVSVVTFASAGLVAQPLMLDKATAAFAVNTIAIDPKEESGYTNTSAGIALAAAELSSVRHNNDARKVIVLLTDGLATAEDGAPDPEQVALNQALSAKATGINIYTIGLGASVKMEFLEQIASVKEQAYNAVTAADVDRIYQQITASICEQGAAVIDIVPKSTSGFVPLR